MLTQFVHPVECVYRAHLSLTLGGKFSFKHCMVAQSLAFIKNCVLFGFLSTGAMIHISSNTPSWLWELQNFQYLVPPSLLLAFFCDKNTETFFECVPGEDATIVKLVENFWGGSKVLQMCDLCTRCLCITHLGPESAQSNVSDSLVCGLESERASPDLSLSLSFRRVNGDFWRKIIFHFDPEINCSV